MQGGTRSLQLFRQAKTGPLWSPRRGKWQLQELRTPVRGTERHKLAEIGSYFNVGYTSVVYSRKRDERWLRKHRRLKKRVIGGTANDK